MNKKKMTGAIIISVLLVFGLLVSHLFFTPSLPGHKQVRFMPKNSRVDLSKFASQVDPELEQTVVARQIIRTPEIIRQEFDDYVLSPALPHLPLLEEPEYKPAVTTASSKVAVVAKGEELSRPATGQLSRRGFRHSFSSKKPGGEVGLPEQEKNIRFRAKLFGDAVLSAEMPVKLQVLEAFMMYGCEVKKNTVITAIAKFMGHRVEVTITGLPVCGEIVTCHFSAYGTDGQRGIYINIPEQAAGRGIQAAAGSAKREALQTVNGVLSTYGGAAGRVLGSGLSDIVNNSGRPDNPIILPEGVKMLFKAE